jgi:hypothetical protein
MKTSASLLLALAFAVAAGAQTTPPASPPVTKIILDEPAAGTTAAPKKDDRKKDGKKKEEPPPKIEGMEIARGSGFLGLQLVNGTFKLSFYDAKKKPVAPDVTRAALRWNVNYQSTPEHTVLNPDGKSLTSAKAVKPPYAFKLFITLIKGEGGDAVTENFTVDFHQ